jgi:hypothetical protein
MKFDVAYVLHRITPARCAELFFDAEFAQAMKRAAGTKSLEELERREEGTRVHRRIRVVPERTVPAPFKRFLRGEVAFVEDSVFDRAALTVEWRSVASVWTDKFELWGTTTFSAAGDDVERRIVGEARVHVSGVGGVVERLLVKDLTETQGRIVELAQRWIDDGHRGP